MAELLLVYDNSSVNCNDVELAIIEKHIPCLVQAGFCNLTREHEWFLERGISSRGFPYVIPEVNVTLPLANTTHPITTYYYQQLNNFKTEVTFANDLCVEEGEFQRTICANSWLV